jgi:hypothetical protein
MDLTGEDYVIFTFEQRHEILCKFINAMSLQWRDLALHCNDGSFALSGKQLSDKLFNLSSNDKLESFMIYCKPELEDFHSLNGFSLTEQGIGALAILFGTRSNIQFRLGNVLEEFSDRDLTVASSPDPYSATLVSKEILEITLVTPAPIDDSSFCMSALNLLENSIRI